MKKVTKVLSILFASVFVLATLAGCGGTASSTPPEESGTAPASTAAEGGTEAAGDVFRVGMVTDQGIDESEWLKALNEGMQAEADADAGLEWKIVEGGDIKEYESKIRAMAEEGYDLVLTMYGDMVEQTVAVAADYPDTMFGSMDGYIENIEQYANIQEFSLDRLESGFLAGVVAAMTSETGKVGVVGGVDQPVINAIIAGWQQGLVYQNPDIEDLVVYVGDFNDPTGGKEHGLSLVDRGCDVIAGAAGGSSVGAAQAAAETNTCFVAWDIHYPEVFTGEQLELGSAINYFDKMVISFVQDAREGRFTPGVRTEYGMASGACDFVILDDSPVSDEIRARVQEVKQEIEDGKIAIGPDMLHK